MALVDILQYLPKAHPRCENILYLYQRLAQGLKNAQNPANGLWYQVLNQYHKADNYPEISGSGMIVYALKKGVDLNLLTKDYLQVAQRGWQGMQRYIITHQDGGPLITSVAPGMGSQMGYQGYVAIKAISVPRKETKQYSHGYVALLMASSVMETY